MKLCGHTMGTPELDIYQATELMAGIGYEAVEIICASNYASAIQTDWTDDSLSRLRRHLDRNHLSVACVTPYLHQINSPDAEARNACLKEAERIIEMAHQLGARGIRILAGTGVKTPEARVQATDLLVQSLRQLSEFAVPRHVELWLENHSGSLADSALHTANIVRQTGSAHVGIVYDQANLDQLQAEPYDEALRLQMPYIRHVHVKDKRLGQRGPDSSALLGEGDIVWPPIIKRLLSLGYAGYFCYEYERRWAPDVLPSAEIGMAHGYRYLTEIVHDKSRVWTKEGSA